MAENGSSNDPKMKNFNIRFNFSWLYIILILGIGYLLLNNKGANPQKVEWPEVQEMVRAGDVKEITYIRNDYRGSVTMPRPPFEVFRQVRRHRAFGVAPFQFPRVGQVRCGEGIR